MASIRQQEALPNPTNVPAPDKPKIELSVEEEKFLEEKILEILDRNKRGEGYVQKAQAAEKAKLEHE